MCSTPIPLKNHSMTGCNRINERNLLPVKLNKVILIEKYL